MMHRAFLLLGPAAPVGSAFFLGQAPWKLAGRESKQVIFELFPQYDLAAMKITPKYLIDFVFRPSRICKGKGGRPASTMYYVAFPDPRFRHLARDIADLG